jgi:hypothetical protein
MYRAGPPGPPGKALRVSRASRRTFAGSSDAAADPELRRYLSDLVRPYGLALRDEPFARAIGQSYGEMTAALLAETMPADQPVDLVVFAFAVSDVVPGRSTAAYLSRFCPGTPLAFAICDQGVAAPYTALRLISAYARTTSCGLALLVVAEQAALHYHLPVPAPMPAVHAAAALVLGESGAGALSATSPRPGVSPAQAADLLQAELARLPGGRADVTLIAGNGLTGSAAVTAEAGWPRVIAVPAGRPVTGVWSTFADGLAGWQVGGQRVVLADYDPVLGYFCVCGIDVAAGQVTEGCARTSEATRSSWPP